MSGIVFVTPLRRRIFAEAKPRPGQRVAISLGRPESPCLRDEVQGGRASTGSWVLRRRGSVPGTVWPRSASQTHEPGRREERAAGRSSPHRVGYPHGDGCSHAALARGWPSCANVHSLSKPCLAASLKPSPLPWRSWGSWVFFSWPLKARPADGRRSARLSSSELAGCSSSGADRGAPGNHSLGGDGSRSASSL